MSDKPKQIGLMGCGAVAGYGHIPAILETPGLCLQSIFDPDPGRMACMQKRFGIAEGYTDVGAFLKSGIDAVTITSPAPFHRENVLVVADHALPVLCEKPLSMNRAEALEMIAVMKQAGVSFYTAFCYRFSPSALKIRELVKSKAVGEVRSLRLIYNWGAHGKYEVDGQGKTIIQKRREERMLEGGPMVDCGTHQIDLAMFWLGSDIVRYTGHGAWVDEYEAPDHMWLHLDHACGAHVVVEMSYSYHHTATNRKSEFVYELIGSRGVIRYDRERAQFTMEDGSGRHEFEFHPEKSFSGMYLEWSNALVSGHSDLLTSAEDGLRVTDIARTATDEAINQKRAANEAGI